VLGNASSPYANFLHIANASAANTRERPFRLVCFCVAQPRLYRPIQRCFPSMPVAPVVFRSPRESSGLEGALVRGKFQIMAYHRRTGLLFGHDDYPCYIVLQFSTLSASDGN
jgi:hypothetical protein